MFNLFESLKVNALSLAHRVTTHLKIPQAWDLYGFTVFLNSTTLYPHLAMVKQLLSLNNNADVNLVNINQAYNCWHAILSKIS